VRRERERERAGRGYARGGMKKLVNGIARGGTAVHKGGKEKARNIINNNSII